ncbi:prolipoprotein diacylglyceryl transferase family protein [uncultured Desulfosarcina sp.]|uniref:prolipoprotein diacylglyceryl transferase family protein n=1 Tax=uncultured Desulfosarcina sp. TaxID=218289 RepID=UPI0029C64BE0|nr:prolipoprotein diacylglyceryl transferase family protein [uncultured Desulfosarcina sp.]
MANWLFVTIMALLLAPVYLWCFKALPGERWQIICAIPVKKMIDGTWQGLNLTYYGLFNAMALCAAVTLVLILTAAAGIDFGIFSAIITVLLGVCLPGSRLIARWVEKKPYTFSVGAASFLGIVLGPWLVLLVEAAAKHFLSISFETMAVVSALMVGYTLGEGIGRLACISFGCCYGRPMDQMPPVVQRYFLWIAFTYTGDTKKIAYAHQLGGKRIFAIQAVTAVLYSLGALAGTLLYLHGHYPGAYFFCLLVTQGWRFLSEFLRSDYRGDRKISVYQIMSLLTIPYAVLVGLVFPSSATEIDILAGLHILWNPAAILFLQALWITMFIRTGRSHVTGSALSFHVYPDRV